MSLSDWKNKLPSPPSSGKFKLKEIESLIKGSITDATAHATDLVDKAHKDPYLGPFIRGDKDAYGLIRFKYEEINVSCTSIELNDGKLSLWVHGNDGVDGVDYLVTIDELNKSKDQFAISVGEKMVYIPSNIYWDLNQFVPDD